MSLWLLLVTSISPLSSIFYVKDKQKINVYFNVTALVLRILVLLLGGFYFRSSDWTIFFFGIVSFLLFAVQGIIIKKLTEVVFSNRVLLQRLWHLIELLEIKVIRAVFMMSVV